MNHELSPASTQPLPVISDRRAINVEATDPNAETDPHVLYTEQEFNNYAASHHPVNLAEVAYDMDSSHRRMKGAAWAGLGALAAVGIAIGGIVYGSSNAPKAPAIEDYNPGLLPESSMATSPEGAPVMVLPSTPNSSRAPATPTEAPASTEAPVVPSVSVTTETVPPQAAPVEPSEEVELPSTTPEITRPPVETTPPDDSVDPIETTTPPKPDPTETTTKPPEPTEETTPPPDSVDPVS